MTQPGKRPLADDPSPIVSQKDICLEFFSNVKDGNGKPSNVWKCICGKPMKQTLGKGYGNLWTHVTASHPDYNDIIAKKRLGLPIDSFLYIKEMNVFGWLGIYFSPLYNLIDK
jgi:hypothetical protein